MICTLLLQFDFCSQFQTLSAVFFLKKTYTISIFKHGSHAALSHFFHKNSVLIEITFSMPANPYPVKLNGG